MRRRAVLGILAVALLLAGCSSSSSPKSGGSSLSPATLAARLDAALAGMTSAHLAINAGALGGKSNADVQLDHGAATASALHTTNDGKPVQVLTVGGSSYADVGAAPRRWVPVSADSSNPAARSIASTPNVTDVLTSLSVLVGLVRTSTDVTQKGSHYTFKINPTKGTGNAKLDAMMKLLGSTPVPVDLDVDGKDRPTSIVLHIAFGGSQFPVAVQVSKVNAPLSLHAPPASEVASG